jgi:hypothetical protein
MIRGKPVNQRALSRSRRPGDASQIRIPSVWKEEPKQRFRFGLMIFYRRNRARHCAHIPRAHLFRPSLNRRTHRCPVELKREARRIPQLFLTK